jgi:type IV pilus assembly protein PilN
MIKINLAPPLEKKGGQLGLSGLNLGLVFGGLFVVLLVGLGMWWSALAGDVGRLTREIDDNQRELDRLKTVIAEHQRYRRDKEDLERRVNAIETVAQNQTRPVYLMDTVASVVPAEVYLTRMEERGQQLRFAGVAASSIALSDFMANLKASGKFKEVDLIESRQDLAKTPRALTFEVSARFGA